MDLTQETPHGHGERLNVRRASHLNVPPLGCGKGWGASAQWASGWASNDAAPDGQCSSQDILRACYGPKDGMQEELVRVALLALAFCSMGWEAGAATFASHSLASRWLPKPKPKLPVRPARCWGRIGRHRAPDMLHIQHVALKPRPVGAASTSGAHDTSHRCCGACKRPLSCAHVGFTNAHWSAGVEHLQRWACTSLEVAGVATGVLPLLLPNIQPTRIGCILVKTCLAPSCSTCVTGVH
jgi:hypothetical protein